MSNMIVAPQPDAVEAGARVLMAGGNAVDAAVTAAFVQMIVAPHMCGIGGYVLFNLYQPGTDGSQVIDAPALAGAKVTPTMWEDQIIRPNPDGWGYFLKGKVNDAGYQAICVPGTVQALDTILSRWGTLSWAQALEPAAQLAEAGFLVDSFIDMRWKTKARYPEASSLSDYIRSNAEASRIYLKEDGTTYETGELLQNPDYANTLRHLAQYGAGDFYQGALAERMSADLAANDSFVTQEDLAAYQIRDVETVSGTYRGYRIDSAPAPHGGPTLIEILNILEGYDLGSMIHNSPDYIYLVSMAMKAAFADRNPHFGDPAFVDVPTEWMMSKARAEEWRAHIDAEKTINVSFTPTGTPDTTHVTTVDKNGMSVALTHSLGASSGVITPGLGFMYNNSMINFHPISGHPNSILPSKSRTTGMTPTIVYKDDKPVLTLGAPGATRIITSVLQVILNVLDFGMTANEAVHAARFDCEGDMIKCHLRIPEYVCEEVRRKHPTSRIPYSHGGFALVHAITRDPETGKLAGGADTGSPGMALEVS
ncbi:MAG: gamma-glutamyltransferase family protein [Chloroflexota bacterium]